MNQPISYQDYKRQVFDKWFVGGAARLDKKSFKQITKQLQTVVDVDSRNASQLWQMVEEDTQGQVNKSYLEEIFDVVYEQQQERQDLQFELSNGLRYVHQTVFKNPDTYRVSLQECVQVVQKGFNTGHQQLIEKLASIAKNGSVDRVDFMEFIEHLEQRQMDEAEGNSPQTNSTNNAADAVNSTDAFMEFHEDEEYSEIRDREILGQLRVRMEAVTKELEKIQAAVRTTHPTLLREVYSLARPVPKVLKSYGNYTKQIQYKLEQLRTEVESLRSNKSASSSKNSDELRKANDIIFTLQAELEEKNRMMAGVVQDALAKFHEKVNKEFGNTKLELEEQILALEGKVIASEKALRTAENSVTFLLSANTNLESKVKIATEFNNPKVQQMLERAMDDPSFFEKVVQAVSLQEKAANQGRQDPFSDEVDLEKQGLQEQLERLTKVNDESSEYIQKLHDEIRQLKEKAQSVYQPQSAFGVSLDEAANNADFGLRESVMLDKQPSLEQFGNRWSIGPTKQVLELDFWCDTILKIEGKAVLTSRVKQLESELSLLAVKSTQDQADLRDSRRNCDALDQELRLLKQERINLESTVSILKSDLSSKMIQLGNLTSQVGALQAKLAQQPSQSAVHIVDVVPAPTVEDPKPDYDLEASKQKTNQILANNSLLESLRKPRAPRTEPGEAVFRNGIRVLDTLDKTTAIIDLCIPGRIKSGTGLHHEKEDEGFDFKGAYLKKVAEKTELQDKLEALNKKIAALESVQQNPPVELTPEPETHDLGISAINFDEEKDTAVAVISTDMQTDNLGESQFGDPTPSTVPLEEYQELKEKYEYRLVELDRRTEEFDKLSKHCEDLVRRIAASEEKYEIDIKAEKDRFNTVQIEIAELTSLVEILKQELELSKTQLEESAKKGSQGEPEQTTAQTVDVERSSLYHSTLEFEIQDPPKLVEAEVMEQAEEVVNWRQSTMRSPTRTSVLNANHFSVAAVSRLMPIAAQEQMKEMEKEMQNLQKRIEEKDMLIGNLRELIMEYQTKLVKSTQEQANQTDPLPESAVAIQPAIVSQSVFQVSPNKSALDGVTVNGIRKIYEERIQRLSERIEALEIYETKLKGELAQFKKKDGNSLGNLIGAQFGALTSLFSNNQKKPEEPQLISETFGKKEILSSMFGMDIAPSTDKKIQESVKAVQPPLEQDIPDELPTKQGPSHLNLNVALPNTILQEKYAPTEPKPVKPITSSQKKESLFESVLFDAPPPGTSNPYLDLNPQSSDMTYHAQAPSSKLGSVPQQHTPTMAGPVPHSKDISLNLPTRGYPQPERKPSQPTNYPAAPAYPIAPGARPEVNLGHLFGFHQQPTYLVKPQPQAPQFAQQWNNPLPPGFLAHTQPSLLPPGFQTPHQPVHQPPPQPSFGVVQTNIPLQHDPQSKHTGRRTLQAVALLPTAFGPKHNSKQAQQISK